MAVGPMNQVVMLTGYIDPRDLHRIPNQDVVYGLGWLSLEKEPWSFKCPTLVTVSGRPGVRRAHDRDQRTWVAIRHQARFLHGRGPDWKGATPAGIAGVVRSTTEFAVAMPRIFMDDTPEDHAAIQPALSQIQYYPLSQFDGKMKTKDWNKLPHFPLPEEKTRPEYSTKQPPWVDPAVFFDSSRPS
jgi:Uncharacterized conserved protein